MRRADLAGSGFPESVKRRANMSLDDTGYLEDQDFARLGNRQHCAFAV